MKAFVINEDQIKTLGLGLLGLVVVVFLAGYFFGSMGGGQAKESQQLENKVSDEKVANIENAETDMLLNKNKIQSKQPLKKVDNKENKKRDDKKQEKQINKTKSANKKSENKKSENKRPVKEEQSKVAKKDKAKIKEPKNQIPQNKKPENKQSENNNTKPAALTTKPAPSLNKNEKPVEGEQVYLIQAGMFSSETNANAFIKKLSDKKFDAYLSRFVSSSGATKYNVRIGKFEKRDQARELLREFQKSFSSPAYVVISQP